MDIYIDKPGMRLNEQDTDGIPAYSQQTTVTILESILQRPIHDRSIIHEEKLVRSLRARQTWSANQALHLETRLFAANLKHLLNKRQPPDQGNAYAQRRPFRDIEQ